MLYNGFVAVVCLGAFLAFMEWTTIHFNIPRMHSRKIVHVGTSLLVVLFAHLFGWSLFIFLGALFVIVLGLVRLIHPLESISDRTKESVGEILFPLGVMIAASICQTQQSFLIAILILGLADTVAFYIGCFVKSPQLIHGKTIAGSLAFFIVALIIGLTSGNVLLAFTLAAATTVAELTGTRGLDNVTVPCVAALVFLLL